MAQAIEAKRPKPFILMILDGLGVAPPGPGNAVTLAGTPILDSLWFKYPHCYLHASGSAVGLPSGTNGNSEVGHMNIGAGKVVFQELPRIDNAIANGTFFQNQSLLKAIKHIKETNGKLHLLGLVSRGRVHSAMEHAFGCVDLCRREGLGSKQLCIHVFTDGRDTPPKSAITYIEELEGECQRQKIGQIVSVCGRFFAMDRDERWDRTKLAYDLLVSGIGKPFSNWREAVQDAYNINETDEYIEPRVIVDKDQAPLGTVNSGDSIIFFNYRPDRAIQLTKAFIADSFNGWDRGAKIEKLEFVGMNEYEEGIPEYAAYPPEDIKLPLGRLVSEAGMRQLRISESEKFPHVTYFLNGGNDIPYQGEDRIEIPSPKDVTTYDQKPVMSAPDLTKVLLEKISEGTYDFIVVNYANPDMVGHTGNLQAAISAIEYVDKCVGQVVESTIGKGGALLITADHGNAEEMINLQTGKVDTEHSTNPVPFIFVAPRVEARELSLGILGDIAPTVLAVLGMQKPSSMTGRNLLI
ncbi:MAG: 2,3-bisphosphoglycerate-independent phosphoglycerate mutase [Candidatus Dojkabacteria bacterium]|nr:2,3-bisphosphoglycerate-independent phosphoglycerate mutase [Candidatus Dojkabacteria bacterium]